MSAVDQFPEGVVSAYLTGSTAIYGVGKDIDYVVLVADRLGYCLTACLSGWDRDAKGSASDVCDFTSLRKEDVNLIVTDKRWLFEAFVIATDTAVRMKEYMHKEDKAARIKLFETTREIAKNANREVITC